jgi:hypothetical protein
MTTTIKLCILQKVPSRLKHSTILYSKPVRLNQSFCLVKLVDIILDSEPQVLHVLGPSSMRRLVI